MVTKRRERKEKGKEEDNGLDRERNIILKEEVEYEERK
jgi:hypothetical protein